MKKTTAICLTGALLLLLSACGNSTAPAAPQQPESSAATPTAAPTAVPVPTAFEGMVMEVNAAEMVVSPRKDSPEADLNNLFPIPLSSIRDDSLPMVGDIYKIEYSGDLMSLYPDIIGADITSAEEKDLRDFADAPEYFQWVEVVPECPPSMGFTFPLPHDWSVEITQTEDEPTSTVTAHLRPKDAPEGDILIEYMGGLGLCGTGLKTEAITLNGMQASRGTYYDNDQWGHIVFGGEYKGCAVINRAGPWFDEYANSIEIILNGLRFVKYEA